jgi:hypothetical protein
LIDDNYNHNSNHNSLFFTKANSFASSGTFGSAATPNTNLDTASDSSIGEDFTRQVQLNLRISTVGDALHGALTNHVSKIMIQNYSSMSGDSSLA